jgi:ceramide synthetase
VLASNTRIGLVVFAVHDAADPFLHIAKIFKYFKFTRVCDTMFVGFVLAWLASRVVLFPIVTNTTFVMLVRRIPLGIVRAGDFSESMCLVLLLCLHMYWTTLIVKMAYNAIMIKEVKGDIRSDDD